MSTVKAVAGATEAQFKSLTAVARELGSTTRFTATQAAEGLVELARAGFEVDEQLVSISQTLALAQAGALDLARAAEITSGTIRGFRLEADQAGRVTDVLALAANSSATDVNQLGEAIKFVAPAAAGLNVSLEETVAVLQVLADSMLKGTLGGTGLRRVLIELESPSTKTRRILKDLGVEAKEFRVSAVGLAKAIEVLRDAGVGASLAFKLFGLRGGGAFEIMSKGVPKIRAAEEALRGAEGTAKTVSEIMDDNLNGALLRVKSAWEAVQLSFGASGATDALITLLEKLAGALRFLAENIEIINVAIIALAIVAVPKLVAALALLAPVLGLLALGAAIGGLIAFRHEIDLSKDSIATLGDFATAVWERIGEGAQSMFDLFRSAFPELGSTLRGFFSGLDISLEGFIKGAARLLDTYVGLWASLGFAIQAIWRNLGAALKDTTISMLNGIISIFETALKRIIIASDKVFSILPGVGRILDDARLAKLAELELITRIKNTTEGAFTGMGEAVIDGLVKGMDTSIFEDSVNSLFDRADAIANERLEKLGLDLIKEASAEALPGTETGLSTTGAADGAPTSAGQSLAFAVTLENIDREVELLRMSNSERTIANQLKKIENNLAEKGIDLSEQQKETINVELRRLQVIQQTSAAVDEVVGAEINLAAAQEELNRQVDAGNISLQQAAQAYRLLQNEALEASRTMEDGFRRGFDNTLDAASDFASQAENTVTNAFSSMEDALVSFAQTGKLSFQSLVNGMLADLSRLLIRMLLVNAVGGLSGFGGLGSLFGGGGGGGAGGGGQFIDPGVSSGRANGGDVAPGTFFPVGERGVELFTPSQPGQIISNEKIAEAFNGKKGKEQAVTAPAQITVILVKSDEEAFAAMESVRGTRIIVNTVDTARREQGRLS